MGLKTKNFNIMEVQQCLREGGYKKNIYIYVQGAFPKKGAWQKKSEEGVFEEEERVDTPMHTMTQLGQMPEPEIGLADVNQLN